MSDLARYDAACRALADCSSVDEVREIGDKAVAIRAYAKQAGNLELKADAERIIIRAKERLGQLLPEIDLHKGGRPSTDSKSESVRLSDLGIGGKLSSDSQHIAALPEELKAEALAAAEPLKAVNNLLAKARREARHKAIAAQSSDSSGAEGDRRVARGTFALVYADPPWKFQTYSEVGLMMSSPDNHYPTMALEEIAGLEIEGRKVAQLAAKDAGLFMWCTSSNLELALPILRCWGFTYRTHLIWDKVRTGTGYIWLNQHELLLYAKRGEFPMPAIKLPSVLTIERKAHSAKPREVRDMLAAMYPHFDEKNRIELFARGNVPGWTTWGNES